MNRAAVITRVVSYGLALFLIFLMSAEDVLTLFIFLGQGHFILSYWYKSERIPRIWNTHLFAIWILALSLLFTATILDYISYNILIAFTATLFVIHFVVDEVSLTKSGSSWIQSLGLFGGVFCVFTLEIIQLISSIQYHILLLICLGILSFITTLILTIRHNHVASFSYYGLLVAFASSCIILGTNSIPLNYSLGFIILSHYFIWYGHYLLKLKESRLLQMIYIKRVLGLNILLLGIFLYTQSVPNTPILDYFFSETYFYVWTCLHILVALAPHSLQKSFA